MTARVPVEIPTKPFPNKSEKLELEHISSVYLLSLVVKVTSSSDQHNCFRQSFIHINILAAISFI
jgi:hypothetical protein